MKHDTFLILKLLIKFLKELVVGQGLFSAKSPCLTSKSSAVQIIKKNVFLRKAGKPVCKRNGSTC